MPQRSVFPAIVLTALFLFCPVVSEGQEVYIDWLTASGSAGTFEFGATITGAIAITNPMNGVGSIPSVSIADGAANYPETWYSPDPPPVGTEWGTSVIENQDGVNPGSADWVVTFSDPVINPRFHFVNLDAATVDFSLTTDSGGNPVVTSLASGNPEFEATGDVYNSTPRNPTFNGCESAAGTNPEGACGTVQLTGTYLEVTFRCTDTSITLSGGDGFLWTISAATPIPVELQSFSVE